MTKKKTCRFKHFGTELKRIRLEQGLTQAEVGEKIGVHSQFVSNAERFLCALPKVNMNRFVRRLSLTKHDRELLLGALIIDHTDQARSEWSKALGF